MFEHCAGFYQQLEDDSSDSNDHSLSGSGNMVYRLVVSCITCLCQLNSSQNYHADGHFSKKQHCFSKLCQWDFEFCGKIVWLSLQEYFSKVRIDLMKIASTKLALQLKDQTQHPCLEANRQKQNLLLNHVDGLSSFLFVFNISF